MHIPKSVLGYAEAACQMLEEVRPLALTQGKKIKKNRNQKIKIKK
jgi:hypothetical protein